MSIMFSGLGLHLGNLARLSNAETRSISAENPTGGKGQGGMATEGTGAVAARELGQGWKVSPCIHLAGNSVVELANVEGPGAIQQLWMTVKPEAWRQLILRCYWDHEDSPSVEVPLGDFFCSGWCERCNVNSLPISVNPAGGFNSYWEMPFRRHARITIENLSPDEVRNFFYQLNYTLTEVPDDRAYFHAQWRRNNPLPYKEVHTLLDGVSGPRTLRWHLPCLGGQQYRLVGRRRDQVLPGWRQGVAYDLRHRHRGLLRWRLGIPFSGRGVRGVFHAVSRVAPSDRPRKA